MEKIWENIFLNAKKGMTFVGSSCWQNNLLEKHVRFYAFVYTLLNFNDNIFIFVFLFPFTTCLELKPGIGQMCSTIHLPIIFCVLNFVRVMVL